MEDININHIYAVLEQLIDDNECSFDHHGYCQEHGWMDKSTCPHALAKEILKGENLTCKWTLTDDDQNLWETECDGLFILESDSPKENKMEFCCYCGKKLVI